MAGRLTRDVPAAEPDEMDQWATIFRRPIGTQNNYGEAVQTEEELPGSWVSLQALSGREAVQAQQVSPDATYRVRMRHRTDVGETCAFVISGRRYNVTHREDVGQQGAVLSLLCESAGVI